MELAGIVVVVAVVVGSFGRLWLSRSAMTKRRTDSWHRSGDDVATAPKAVVHQHRTYVAACRAVCASSCVASCCPVIGLV